MEDALSFADYIQGDAHGDFRLGADTKSWTRRKLVLMRELRGMPDEGEAWAKNFASTVSFTGSRDEFIDRLVGYMLLEDVTPDFATGAFKKSSSAAPTVPAPGQVDPAILKLLEDQGQLIKSLTAKVQSITEAPPKDQLQVRALSLKAIHDADTATNHPQWINRALFLLVRLLKFENVPASAVTMIPKMSDAAAKEIMLGLTDEDRRDDTPWTDRKHPDGSDSMDTSDSAQVSERFHTLVQALWTLVFSATASYKERYEGTSGSSSTSGSQKESDVRLEEGLSEAGKRLKKAMRRRFKVIDGEEFFEIHKNEWVCTTEDPVGPCKTCKARGEVTRHWVWRCPFLE